MFDGTGLLLIFMSLGLVLSLPVFLLYLFMFNWIIRRINSELIIKTTLDVAGILAIVVTFVLLIQGELAVAFAICYSIALVVSSLIFTIGPRKGELIDATDRWLRTESCQ